MQIKVIIIGLCVLIGFLAIWGVNKNIALKRSDSLNSIIINQAKESLLKLTKQAENDIKNSQVRYDSIYALHLESEKRAKFVQKKLIKQLNEIKNFTPVTRNLYVDSVLRANNVR